MSSIDCLFCKVVSKQIPARVILENEHVVAFEDINPQAPVHILVVPRQHLVSVNDLSETHAELVGYMTLAANAVAKTKGVDVTGYRLVMNTGADAGQSVFHLHMHLLGGRHLGWPPG
jgi:histidine triad (HIT) family protein